MKKITAFLTAAVAAFSLTVSGFAADVIPEDYNGYAEQSAFGETLTEELNSQEEIVVYSVSEEMLAENTAEEVSDTSEDENGFSMQDFLKKLAVEYTLLGKECEKEDMREAAIANYKKALELCPDIPDAKRRLKKLDPDFP